MARRLLPFLTLLLLSTPATPAQADLRDDAERILRMWSDRGARAARLPPIFLEHGHLSAIGIGPMLPPSPAAAKGGDDCLTVALLTDRSAEFTVDLQAGKGPFAVDKLLAPRGGVLEGATDEARPRSVAGAMVLGRCGVRRSELRRMALELRAGRAALEIVAARSAHPLGDIAEVLPERAFGPMAPRGNPGEPLDPAPLSDRLARAERTARADGAEGLRRVSMRASPQGTGEFDVKLGEGCHRLEIMAETPASNPRPPTDVDAELRDAESGRVIARDRSDAPDARLEACFGDATFVEIPYTGAAGPMSVSVTDAVWPIPKYVPRAWGARARAGFAWALRRRRAPEPTGPASFQSIGATGVTLVPMPVEPNRCYLASVATARGDARALRIAALLGLRDVHDDATDRTEGVMVAFCTRAERNVVIEVEARGASPWWVLAAWPMSEAP